MTLHAKIYKVGVNLPKAFLDEMMDTINDCKEPIYPKYDRTFMFWPMKGTWRSLPGADPYDGEAGKITVAEEYRLEFAVKEEELQKVIKVIADKHPYEEPIIDVIPMIPWKDLLQE